MTDAELTGLEELLWAGEWTRDVWMIVDAARDRRIYPKLMASYLDVSCLYSGALSPVLERAAPYLVRLEYQGSYSRELIRAAWGNNWGVLLRCDASLERLRRHLRRFLMVLGPGGDQLVFRYYDPRVLRVYLPTCREGELRTIFGPIECFWTEDQPPAPLQEFRLEKAKLIRKPVTLAPSALAVV